MKGNEDKYYYAGPNPKTVEQTQSIISKVNGWITTCPSTVSDVEEWNPDNNDDQDQDAQEEDMDPENEKTTKYADGDGDRD